jgi:hypothetical protein
MMVVGVVVVGVVGKSEKIKTEKQLVAGGVYEEKKLCAYRRGQCICV